MKPACEVRRSGVGQNLSPSAFGARLLVLIALIAAAPLLRSMEPSELIAAIRGNDLRKARELLEVPEQVQARDARGNTALHWAALAGDAPLVSRLLAAGLDARATNSAGATPLHYGTGNATIVRALLAGGADPNARSASGSTPLHSAASRPGGFQIVKLLIQAGADLNAQRLLFPSGVNAPTNATNFTGVNPLTIAIYSGDPRSAELLLKSGAEPGGAFGFTPLATAALAGRGELMIQLLDHGATPNVDDGFVGNALNNLLYGGHAQLVPLVLEHGVDLHQTSSIGEKTPPMVWSAYTDTADTSVAEALLARGLDVNEPTSAGHTALDWALKRGETPLVAYLRSRGGTNSAPLRNKDLPTNAIPQESSARAALLRDSGATRTVAPAKVLGPFPGEWVRSEIRLCLVPPPDSPSRRLRAGTRTRISPR